LRHQRDAGEPQGPNTLVIQIGQPSTRKPYHTRRDPPGRLDHAQDRQCQGRFARTRFAREAEPIACGEGEADIVDGLNKTLRVVETDT
jgi:hypothetical protein